MPSNLAAAATRSGSMAKWLSPSVLRKRRKPLLPTMALSPCRKALSNPARARGAGGGIVAGFSLVVADDIVATARVALAGLDRADDLLDLKPPTRDRTASRPLRELGRLERTLFMYVTWNQSGPDVPSLGDHM